MRILFNVQRMRRDGRDQQKIAGSKNKAQLADGRQTVAVKAVYKFVVLVKMRVPSGIGVDKGVVVVVAARVGELMDHVEDLLLLFKDNFWL